MAQTQPTVCLTLCGLCPTPRLWRVAPLKRHSTRRTPTTEKRFLSKSARRRYLNSTLRSPVTSTRSSTILNLATWGQLKQSSRNLARGTDPARALLSVSSSALLASSPTAATASARPSQGLTPLASAGGVVAASKRPLCFRVPPVVLARGDVWVFWGDTLSLFKRRGDWVSGIWYAEEVQKSRGHHHHQIFPRPLKGEIGANTTGGTRKYKGRLDTATTPPAEASGVSGAMPTVGKKKVWCSCETESGSCVAAMGSPGESTRSWKRSRIRRAQPRCAVRPQKRRVFCLRKDLSLNKRRCLSRISFHVTI